MKIFEAIDKHSLESICSAFQISPEMLIPGKVEIIYHSGSRKRSRRRKTKKKNP